MLARRGWSRWGVGGLPRDAPAVSRGAGRRRRVYESGRTHFTARECPSGAGFEPSTAPETATVWTLEDGQVTRLALHWNASEGLEAVGLSHLSQRALELDRGAE